MEYKEFVNETVMYFEDEAYQATKNTLAGEYLVFNVIGKEAITREILAEKVCDYFEKVELKTGKPFDKQIAEYMENLDSIIENHIAKTPKKKKKEESVPKEPRARKYYDKADEIRGARNTDLEMLIDYSRIMLCLYTEIIKEDHKAITDFEFSADCLDQDKILSAMKKEKKIKPPIIGSKGKTDVKGLYGLDACTFVITILMLQTILNERAWWKK